LPYPENKYFAKKCFDNSLCIRFSRPEAFWGLKSWIWRTETPISVKNEYTNCYQNIFLQNI
jgi:hypothetical protein